MGIRIEKKIAAVFFPVVDLVLSKHKDKKISSLMQGGGEKAVLMVGAF